MYFTSGSDRAFEQLMQGKPGFDHYDSGEAVTPEDCGTCRFYRPHWKYQFCVYAECPYQPGKLTAYDAVTFRVKGVENRPSLYLHFQYGSCRCSNRHRNFADGIYSYLSYIRSAKKKCIFFQRKSLFSDWTNDGGNLENRYPYFGVPVAYKSFDYTD